MNHVKTRLNTRFFLPDQNRAFAHLHLPFPLDFFFWKLLPVWALHISCHLATRCLRPPCPCHLAVYVSPFHFPPRSLGSNESLRWSHTVRRKWFGIFGSAQIGEFSSVFTLAYAYADCLLQLCVRPMFPPCTTRSSL
jgi:hypothetical protein